MRLRVVSLLVLLLSALIVSADPSIDARRGRLVAEAQAQAQSGKAAAILTFNGRKADVLSWSWGATQTTSQVGGGIGAGKVNIGDFHVAKALDGLSSTLFQAVATGSHVAEATIEVLDERGRVIAQFKLKNVIVSSYQTGGSSGTTPIETVSLNFATVEYILIGL